MGLYLATCSALPLSPSLFLCCQPAATHRGFVHLSAHLGTLRSAAASAASNLPPSPKAATWLVLRSLSRPANCPSGASASSILGLEHCASSSRPMQNKPSSWARLHWNDTCTFNFWQGSGAEKTYWVHLNSPNLVSLELWHFKLATRQAWKMFQTLLH